MGKKGKMEDAAPEGSHGGGLDFQELGYQILVRLYPDLKILYQLVTMQAQGTGAMEGGARSPGFSACF